MFIVYYCLLLCVLLTFYPYIGPKKILINIVITVLINLHNYNFLKGHFFMSCHVLSFSPRWGWWGKVSCIFLFFNKSGGVGVEGVKVSFIF